MMCTTSSDASMWWQTGVHGGAENKKKLNENLYLEALTSLPPPAPPSSAWGGWEQRAPPRTFLMFA